MMMMEIGDKSPQSFVVLGMIMVTVIAMCEILETFEDPEITMNPGIVMVLRIIVSPAVLMIKDALKIFVDTEIIYIINIYITMKLEVIVVHLAISMNEILNIFKNPEITVELEMIVVPAIAMNEILKICEDPEITVNPGLIVVLGIWMIADWKEKMIEVS